MPYVVTNPPRTMVVGKDDLIYALCRPLHADGYTFHKGRRGSTYSYPPTPGANLQILIDFIIIARFNFANMMKTTTIANNEM